MDPTPLFGDGELAEWLDRQTKSAVDLVKKASAAKARESPDWVYDQAIENWEVTPLTISWDDAWRDDPREIPAVREEWNELIRYTAYGIKVHVPFTGTAELFRRRPSTRSLGGRPVVGIGDNEIVLDIQMMVITTDGFDQLLQSERDHISSHVGYANAQVAAWNDQFRTAVASAVSERKNGLESANEVARTLSIPARPAPAATQIRIPAERKSVRVLEQPSESTERRDLVATPEYALETEIYEDVVRTLRAVGNSFERLPRTVIQFDEEELRDVLLFILNSNYEGAAAGELFNGAGKTDILVRHEDRNAFIGECKKWGGAAAFGRAVDQLLSYTVWRDTKAALILFIENNDAGAVIEKADQTIRAHESFVRAVDGADPLLRRDYVLHAKDDPSQLIATALLPIVIRPA